MQKNVEEKSEQSDEFVNQSDVAEVIDIGIEEEPDEEMDSGGEEADGEKDQIEIDMSNNSSAYFDRHADSVYLIASHPTLPMVVTGGGDDKAYLWTTHSVPTKLVTELNGFSESVVAGGFTSDGKYVVLGDMSGQVRVWRAKSGGEKWEFYTQLQDVDEVVWIRFHPKQPIAAVGAQDGSVWVYEIAPKFTQLAVLQAHAMPTTNALFVNTDDADWLTLMTISEDSSIICWNVYQSQTIYQLNPTKLRGEHPWISICPSPSGKTVAVGSADGQIAIIKVDDGSVLQKFETTGEDTDLQGRSIEGLAWSDKTGLLAAGNVNGDIFLYSPANWKIRVQLKLKDAVTKLEFVPGKAFLVSSGMDESIDLWDSLSGQLLWEGKGHSGGILGFVIQKDRIITAGDDGISLVYNPEPLTP